MIPDPETLRKALGMEGEGDGSRRPSVSSSSTPGAGSKRNLVKPPFIETLSFRTLLLVVLFITFMPVVRLYGQGVGNPSWATTPVLIMYKYAYGNFQTGCNTQTDTGCTITWPGVSQAAQGNATAMIWVSLFIVMAYQILVMRSMSDKYKWELLHVYRHLAYGVAIVLVCLPMLYFAGYTTINDALMFTLAVQVWIQQPHRALVALQKAQEKKETKVWWTEFVPELAMGVAYDILLALPIVISANASSYTPSTTPLQQAMYSAASYIVVAGTGVTVCTQPMILAWRKSFEGAHTAQMTLNELVLILFVWTVGGLTASALFYSKQTSY